jgi:spore coat polysaccharide biosynthesis predicted glycosyltransferase SpsG/CMP-N-acetylneuraminic acid synthetase
MKVWFIVPARGGSKTIPKKNIRHLAGKPLVLHCLDTIGQIAKPQQIVVSTDDDNIKALVEGRAVIHDRSNENANDLATLDDVAVEVSKYLLKNGGHENDLLFTCQPTSPFITLKTFEKAIEIHQSQEVDTVLTVMDDRHLRWTEENGKLVPLFKARVNRQQMSPVFRETGGLISARLHHIIEQGSRIGKEIAVIVVDEKEGVDIDTFADWSLAEYWAHRLKICIRVDGSSSLGFGHLYRALAIAQNIYAHEVSFVTRSDGEYEFGFNFLKNHHYPITEVSSNSEFIKSLDKIQPDIVINDILDTDVDYVSAIKVKGCFVVNFEDLGRGNAHADIVINDLYPDLYPKSNHWYGVEHAILNPNMEVCDPRPEPAVDVNHILISYGGTDPSNLTLKAIEALISLDYDKEVTIILGPGSSNYKKVKGMKIQLKGKVNLLQNISNMAVLMQKADLALTSAGRTVTELMTIGVPTITMCQNLREMRHNHASSTFGLINLGFGDSVTVEVLAEHIQLFIKDVSLRRDMYWRMRKALKHRSNSSIVSKIINTYKKRK